VKSCDREETVSLWWTHVWGASAGVAKVVTMDESWCDESVYECLGEVRRVV
jgi:hypothetical protein